MLEIIDNINATDQSWQQLPWASPLHYAAGISPNERYWALLYSGMTTRYSGRFSLLALKPQEQITASTFAPLAARLSHDRPWQENLWLGYLGYGLKHDVEHLPPDLTDEKMSFPTTMPDLWMLRYGLILLFDHQQQQCHAWASSSQLLREIPSPAPIQPAVIPTTTHLSSPTTKEEYLAQVQSIQTHIHAGDMYQANLTRKFNGLFSQTPHMMALFARLTEVSPACYSALLKLDDTWIASSSPERFLSISASGCVESRPIKGSAPRGHNTHQDATSRHALQNSPKDRAENLMIVDLMRNDLSHSCIPGSVTIDNLFDVSTYATIHHMATTISGMKKPDCTTLDVIRQCFPPGSMTGAPKIRAMEICTRLERLRRGVYSGAIGWIGGNGACDLSVVIRTLLVKKLTWELQIGGGIVADSLPESEFQETLTKARGIASTLDVDIERFAIL